jgi:hypothetical protein
MVNIEQITSTLAKMPDQALQRYAMMHKDDPYIMSLAVSESKRRKEMRAAGQAQAMQPQPKVVDQAVSDMRQTAQLAPSMPEEHGIGALPAAQQMNFADGGITGYAGGGKMYETPYDRMNRENREAAAAEQAARETQAAERGVTPYGEQMSRMGSAFANIPGEVLKTLVSAPGYGLSNMIGSGSSQPAEVAPVAQPQYNPAEATRRSAYEQGAANMDQAAAARPAAGQMAAYQSGPSVARAPAAPAQSIEDRFLDSQKRMTEQPNPFAAQESAMSDEEKKLAEQNLAGVKASQEKFKDAFAGREARLSEKAKELEKSKDTNTGLAFLEAGLAMMSTPGGLATAIGKGAREGTAKYAAGIDKLRSAQDKLDEAKDRIEELKLNRAELSDKELREAELGIQKTVVKGKRDALDASKALYGKQSDLAKDVTKATIEVEQKALDRASHERTAGAAAAIARKSEVQFVNDWLAKPENKGKSFSDAYAAFKSVGPAAERNDITGLKSVRAGLSKDLEDYRITPSERVAKQARIEEIDNQILSLSGAASSKSAPTSAMPLPANASADTLKVGTIYQTAKGPAKWTGSGFSPI